MTIARDPFRQQDRPDRLARQETSGSGRKMSFKDSGMPDPMPSQIMRKAIKRALASELPPDNPAIFDVEPVLRGGIASGSRWELFRASSAGLYTPRAKAVVDWVHNYVTFGYQFARHTKTAMDVWTERRGVCRDFQHLCITLHRALNLPARYVTGYLGDIGVPYNPAPMDFSAWHEVYLGGRWWSMDGRLTIGRVSAGFRWRPMSRRRRCRGFPPQFGPSWLQSFQVATEEVRENDHFLDSSDYAGRPSMTLFANSAYAHGQLLTSIIFLVRYSVRHSRPTFACPQ